jgi:hypothetical protein
MTTSMTNHRAALRRLLAAGSMTALCAVAASAQERLDAVVTGVGSPTFQSWRFGTSIRQDGINVESARQIAVPLALRVPLGSRVSLEATGAFVQSSIGGADSSGRAISASVSGLTDTRVRATIQLPRDFAAITVGVNLPTGVTALDRDALLVLRTVGAPALRATAPALGLGFGSTVGLVLARRVNSWALGAAIAAEQRSAYTPFEAGLTGTADTELRPGGAIHTSLGANGLVGEHRLSVLTVLDLYSGDEIDVRPTNAPAFTSTYKLGPQSSTAVTLDVASSRARALRLALGHRWRGRFIGSDGAQVTGSAAQALDFSADAVFGAPNRRGFIVGAEARYASRLDLEPSFVTAGVSGAGLKLGISQRAAGLTMEPSVKVFAGQLSLRDGTSAMTSIAFTFSATRY